MRAHLLILLLLCPAAHAQPSAVVPDITVTAPAPGPERWVNLPIYNEPLTLTLATRRAASSAAWALGSASNLAERPAYAAQVLMELEFLNIEIVHHPLWVEANGEAKDLFVEARPEWRGALGISPTARSQSVIDGLFQIMQAIEHGDGPAATGNLPPEVFTLPAAETWARLNAMPYLHASNVVAVAVHRKLRRR